MSGETVGPRTGRCLCGAVRFTAGAVQAEFGACHCDMCLRWAGGPFMAATARDVRWEGAENIATYRSSSWAERAFCRTCGSSLYYRITAEGPHKGDYEILLGLFDDRSGLRVAREIFIDRKPEGYALAGGLPQLTEAEVLAEYAARAREREDGR